MQKLDVLRCVGEYSSVTKAARQLNIAQPAVTAHIRDMERRLGIKIVRREGREIALTEAGRRVLKWAEDVLTRYFEMKRELGGLEDGTIGSAVIAASMSIGTYLLTELLVTFQSRHPNAQIRTIIGDTWASTEAVRGGQCDFAVLLFDPKQNMSDLVLERWFTEPLVLVAAGDEDRVGETANLDDLHSLPFVAVSPSMMRGQIEEEMLYGQGVFSRKVILELGNPEAIKRAVRQGAGVSFVEKTAAQDEIERGLLRVVATPEISMSLPISLCFLRGKTFSPMQRRLFDEIRRAKPSF